MNKKNNTIEINGTRYDARSGEILSDTTAHATKPTMKDVVRRKPARHINGRAPKSGKTLMRHAVHRPTKPIKSSLKAQGTTDKLAVKSLADVIPSKSIKRLDPRLAKRASQVAQSHLIAHFSDVTSDSTSPSYTVTESTLDAPAVPIGRQRPVVKGKPKTSADVLEQALRHARSHEEKLHAKPSHQRPKRKIGTAAVSAAVLLLAAVAGFNQIPNLRLHMASAKAGFNAGLPSYQPAGYSMGQLNYSEGIVASNFHSNSDSRKYTLIQKPSQWNSQALLDNFILSRDRNYQTVEAGGRTIYLYGNHDASWVNAGVWYQIQSDGSLSNHQLVELATSL